MFPLLKVRVCVLQLNRYRNVVWMQTVRRVSAVCAAAAQRRVMWTRAVSTLSAPLSSTQLSAPARPAS